MCVLVVEMTSMHTRHTRIYTNSNTDLTDLPEFVCVFVPFLSSWWEKAKKREEEKKRCHSAKRKPCVGLEGKEKKKRTRSKTRRKERQSSYKKEKEKKAPKRSDTDSTP